MGKLDRRTDVFAAGVVLWEALTGQRLFAQGDLQPAALLNNILTLPIDPPSVHRPELSPAVDQVVLRALEREPSKRFPTAGAMAVALEDALPPLNARQLGDFVRRSCSSLLAERDELVRQVHTPIHDATEVTADSSAPPKRRAWKLAAALLAAAVSATLGWQLARSYQGPLPPELAAQEQAPGELPPVSTVSAEGEGEGRSAESPVEPEQLAAPPSTLSRRSKPSPSPARAVRKKPRTQPPAGASPAPNCDPPTFQGPDGIRHFKKECL
jgi:serine/threonine-protein kinase